LPWIGCTVPRFAAGCLALDGAHLFEPMAGRPMKAWVQVPPTDETQWAELARKAEAGLEG